MGHNAGWLALGAGIAGGADVILIPEIPYDIDAVAEAIRQRHRKGSSFSIVAVSEGAVSRERAAALAEAEAAVVAAKKASKAGRGSDKDIKAARAAVTEISGHMGSGTLALSEELERRTTLESRVTILGHLQRGGTPSAADRLLATRLGAAAAEVINEGRFGVMIASRGETAEPVPLEEVVGKRKTVPPDHPWIGTARSIGTSLGDEA